MEWTSIGVLFVLAFAANLPLGWWRVRQRKFSPLWFLAIHASIPFLIATRFALGVPFLVVPAEFILAIGGQVAGSRLLA